MKKNKLCILLLGTMFISACNEPIAPPIDDSSSNSSNNQDSTSRSDTSSSSIDATKLTKDKVISTLDEMKKGNFTLAYDLSSGIMQDVYTTNYYYVEYLNNGSLLLDTVGENKYAYDFGLSNNMVDLKGQTFNEEQTRQELTSISFANKIANFDFSNAEFTEEKGILTTYSETIIDALAAQLDFSSGLKRVLFYLVNDEITFELQHIDSPITNRYVTPTGGKVTIKNVGNSSISSVEDFLSSWKKPTENLTGKADNLFGNVSFTSYRYDFTIDSQFSILEETTNFDIYNDYLRVTTINSDDVPYQTTYKRKGDSDDLSIIGVNAHNEAVTLSTNKKYSDFALVGKEGFELDKFAKINSNDNYYLYLGSDAQKLAFSITQSSVFAKYKCLKIQADVENGKVKWLHFYTGIMQDKDNQEFFFYRIDTKILDTPNVIDEQGKKTPSENDSTIKGYLDKIVNGTYVAQSVDSATSSTIRVFTKGENFFLNELRRYDGENIGEIELAQAYYYLDGKTYTFLYHEGYDVEYRKTEDIALNDAINFSISSEILSLKDSTITTTGDIINLGEAIAFSQYPDYVDPSSFKMTVENEEISSISCTYGGSGFSGTETISFDYKETTLVETLETNIKNAIPSPTEIHTWQETESTVWDALNVVFGEEIAKKIPYLPANVVFDGYDDEGVAYICAMDSVDGWIDNYKSLLKEKGYTTSDNQTFKNETDNVQIVVGNEMDSYDFLQFSKIA